MSRQTELSTWTETVSNHMPHLSKAQASGLACWSFAIAMTRSCGRSTVAMFLAMLLDQKTNTVQQRLREWCYEAPRKQGRRPQPRQELAVNGCFVPLLQWVISLWQSSQLALVLDATQLGNRFVVLTVSVVYRGLAIPVAWELRRAEQPGSWRPSWLRLLRQLRPAVPGDWYVLVLTDRGLYARWLFRRIVRLGWHPFMRINQGAKFRPAGDHEWYWLSHWVSQPDQHWAGRGLAFKDRQSGHLKCTLLAWWSPGHQHAWFILTDLPPNACHASWYSLRAWCEQCFKCTKRGGWQWQHTRMTDPARAARLWLALAVATLWVVSVGGELEDAASQALVELPDLRLSVLRPPASGRPRRIRIFRLGWLWLLVQALTHQSLPMPQPLRPEPWPDWPGSSTAVLEASEHCTS